jgi:hypothetical protein
MVRRTDVPVERRVTAGRGQEFELRRQWRSLRCSKTARPAMNFGNARSKPSFTTASAQHHLTGASLERSQAVQ